MKVFEQPIGRAIFTFSRPYHPLILLNGLECGGRVPNGKKCEKGGFRDGITHM